MSDSDDDFDAKLWLASTKITEAGLKKLSNHGIIDKEAVLFLTEEDIFSIKLSTGD